MGDKDYLHPAEADETAKVLARCICCHLRRSQKPRSPGAQGNPSNTHNRVVWLYSGVSMRARGGHTRAHTHGVGTS